MVDVFEQWETEQQQQQKIQKKRFKKKLYNWFAF